MNESVVFTIEQYIFEAWSANLSGTDVIDYVCARGFESIAVENTLNCLMNRMYD